LPSLLLGVFVIAAVPAHANVVYNNLGSGGTYSNAPPYALGSACTADCDLAVFFVVSTGPRFDLTQLDVAAVYASTLPNSAADFL
jgi:hypothetical protein